MRTIGLVFLYVFTVGVSQAAIMANQEYRLLDHGYGALGDNYGLRLDSEQANGPGGMEAGSNTFSTELNGAYATLNWDGGNTATITGTLSRNSNGDLWNVLYELTGVVSTAGGFKATGGMGTLTHSIAMDAMFALTGKTNSNGYSFYALSDGHRIPHDDISDVGRGWLYAPGTNDWLVQFTPVPVPAALPLLVSGLLGFSFFSRRKMSGSS